MHGICQKWLDESWSDAILVGKMAKRSILKPEAFRTIPLRGTKSRIAGRRFVRKQFPRIMVRQQENEIADEDRG